MNYRRLFELTPAASYLLASDGKIIACNPAFLRLFGFKNVKEAQTYGMASLYADKRRLPDDLTRLTTDPVYTEQELKRVDGVSIYVVATAVGIFNRNHQLVEVAGFFLEESAILASTQGLDESRRLEMIAGFAGHVAMNLDDWLWIAGDRLPASEATRLLVHTRERIGPASKFRRQLLALSRMQTLRPAPISLNTLLWRLNAMFARTLRPNIELTLELADDLGARLVDHAPLGHGSLGPVINARDAIPTSGRVVLKTENVTVVAGSASGNTLGAQLPPRDYTVLSVSDDGIGMDEAAIERAFYPSYSTKWIANGLGLPAVCGIVKQSRGFIRIQSVPDKGTTILVFLPRTEQEIPILDTVLVVEPDEFRRKAITDALKRCGYQLLIATNGLDACRVAASDDQKIDVLLTEFAMQDMGGTDLAERLLMIPPALQLAFLAPPLCLETSKTAH